jgi:hypothetical protein
MGLIKLKIALVTSSFILPPFGNLIQI